MQLVPTDSYLWLEEILSQESLDWVKTQNAETEALFKANPSYEKIKLALIGAATNQDKMPSIAYRNGWFYNFWQDEANVKGLWRRVPVAQYTDAVIPWETLLDLDSLAVTEGKDWVWGGSNGFYPTFERFMISLSIGGSDAKVVREWDLETKSFVADGFIVPEGKNTVNWVSLNEILVAANFGPESLTKSGYPFQTKRWVRGTKLEDSPVFFEGKTTDVSARVSYCRDKGFEGFYAARSLDFHTSVQFRYTNNTWEKIELPSKVTAGFPRGYIQISLNTDATILGKDYVSGSLLMGRASDFFNKQNTLSVLYAPTDNSSLEGFGLTKDYALLYVSEDVKRKVYYSRIGEWNWQPYNPIPAESIVLVSLQPEESNQVLLYADGFLIPESLYMGDLLANDFKLLKTSPTFFDATPYEVNQHFATSKDGTKVPYFIIHRKDIELNGKNPTLLYGYGGFEHSLTPYYVVDVGLTWLSEGGVYVIGNIRGGGEYGPKWHQAAIRENKGKSYEDFAAIGYDLFNRKITSSQHLGIEGGSNGGLLVGNMTVLYPDLFKAGLCKVPLLDMQRYNKLLAGHSWMAEYGNPDIESDWAFLQKFSPYHNVKAGVKYPALFISTSTKDDRVHPGHARKMVAKLKEHVQEVIYFENTSGGHQGSSDYIMGAHIEAMQYSWLMKQLKG